MVESADGVAGPQLVRPRRLVIGITGGSGTAYGIRLLEVLRVTDFETHLVMCDRTERALLAGTGPKPAAVRKLADHVYHHSNQAARISSGSFLTDGMIIAPCSARSLSAIANGVATNLVQRAADVVMKEGRKLVLLPHESALTHVEVANLKRLAQAGAMVIWPLDEFPAARTVEEDLDRTVARLLGHFGISPPWAR